MASTSQHEMFPSNITIEELKEAIEGRTEFREKQFPDFVIFNYLIMKNDSFPDPKTAPDAKTRRIYQLRRECRGLIVSLDGQILSRRFHKFFNVNENAEYHENNFDWSKPHVVLEKLDGSMLGPFLLQGNVVFATKKGISQVGHDAEEFALKEKERTSTQNNNFANNQNSGVIDYHEFCQHWLSSGWSPLFEWCSRKQPLLLDYPTDKLTLIALRNNITGEYMKHQDLLQAASTYNVPVVTAWEDDSKSFREFMERARERPGVEGCVLKFEDGMMVKVKTNWYYNLSRGLSVETNSNSDKYLWKAILEEKFDDFKSFIAKDELPAIEKFSDDLISRLENAGKQLWLNVQSFYSQHQSSINNNNQTIDNNATQSQENRPSLKREFSNWAKNKDHEPFYWQLFNDNLSLEDTREVFFNYVIKTLNTRKGFDELKKLVGDITFKTYLEKYSTTDDNTRKAKFSDWH